MAANSLELNTASICVVESLLDDSLKNEFFDLASRAVLGRLQVKLHIVW